MQLLVNGESYEVAVDGETTLLAVLRHTHNLGLGMLFENFGDDAPVVGRIVNDQHTQFLHVAPWLARGLR